MNAYTLNTHEGRAEVRRLVEAATPGPWWKEYGDGHEVWGPCGLTGSVRIARTSYAPVDVANAALIAAAPTLLLAALDEIDRLERLAKTCREDALYAMARRTMSGLWEDICPACAGEGTQAYGNTSGWRRGAGGNAITSDVCDQCWGSGDKYHPWPSQRHLEDKFRTMQFEIDRLKQALAEAAGVVTPKEER